MIITLDNACDSPTNKHINNHDNTIKKESTNFQ